MSSDLKVSIFIVDLIDWSTAFHKVGVATLKDRGPWVFKLVGGISSRFLAIFNISWRFVVSRDIRFGLIYGRYGTYE